MSGPARRLRGWLSYRVALCGFPAEAEGALTWAPGGSAEAPAIVLRMSPGASLRVRVDVTAPFTLQSTVSRADTPPARSATLSASARRGGVEVARGSLTLGPDDASAPFSLSVGAGRPAEVTLAAAGDRDGADLSWGCPVLWVRRPWVDIGRAALVTVRGGRAAGRIREALGGASGPRRQTATDPAPTPDEIRRALDALPDRPRVSIVLSGAAARETEVARQCAESIAAQSYPDHEIVRAPRPIDGLRQVTGDLVALISEPGVLAPLALLRTVAALGADPDADVVYTDEDRTDGIRFAKPDWSPEYQLSRLYVGQLAVYRTRTVAAVEDVRDDDTAAADLFLRTVGPTARVLHVREALWRGLGRAHEASEALAAHVRRRCPDARVTPGPRPGCHRVRWPIRGRADGPLVSIVIPTRDRAHLLGRCLASIETRVHDVSYEVVIVDNGSVEPATRTLLGACGHRVIRDEGAFNFARLCNLGARHARGRHLLFLNNDAEAVEEGWLGALVEQSQQEPIGAVGAKLHYPDGRLQHVGMLLGAGEGVAQPLRGAAGAAPGYFDSAVVVRNCSAVTGACLMTRREVFEAAGGFDERFAVDYNDVDYCLRVRAAGRRVVFTPHARLWHHEFATRPRAVAPAEHALFRDRWAPALGRDPYLDPAAG